MCLHHKSDFPLRVKDGYVTAWKVVTKYNRTSNRFFQLKLGQNKAKTSWSKLTDDNNILYKSGFHCFTSRASARFWRDLCVFFNKRKIIKVKIKEEDIHTKGLQSNRKVVVASRIEIDSFDHCR